MFFTEIFPKICMPQAQGIFRSLRVSLRLKGWDFYQRPPPPPPPPWLKSPTPHQKIPWETLLPPLFCEKKFSASVELFFFWTSTPIFEVTVGGGGGGGPPKIKVRGPAPPPPPPLALQKWGY